MQYIGDVVMYINVNDTLNMYSSIQTNKELCNINNKKQMAYKS